MLVSPISDREILFKNFKKDVFLNLYNIADLDDQNWSKSNYYGIGDPIEPEAILMIHTGLAVPILSGMTGSDPAPMRLLLESVLADLPREIYGNFTPGLVDVFDGFFACQSFGEHYRMGLTEPAELLDASENVNSIDESYLNPVTTLIDANMDDHWFHPKMLETDRYFGYFDNNTLVGVGGIHVFSSSYNVAALGNITTDMEYRRKGIALEVVSAVCRDLLKEINHIGLNVKCDNTPAIKCYQRLGFEITQQYEEYMMIRNK